MLVIMLLEIMWNLKVLVFMMTFFQSVVSVINSVYFSGEIESMRLC
jgi:hypothetical protein